jgi:hypothetical protein
MNMEDKEANEKLLRLFREYKNNLPLFTEKLLKIRTKTEGIRPFVLNTHQTEFYNFMMRKKKEEGKHKFIVIKARQTGISTFTQAYYFHNTYFGQGRVSYILTDSSKHTQNIFDMVKLFQDYIPEALRQPIEASNSKELKFSESKSLYKVGTAGTREDTRSGTINNFHGSEVAFWDNTEELLMSIIPSVADDVDNNIILESTANGIGNYFHAKVLEGLDKKSEWQTFFVPWHLVQEYRKEIRNREEFALTDEEKDLKHIYNLDDEQINFRRSIIGDFGGRVQDFKREYPLTINEAFETTSKGLIPIEAIKKARANNRTGIIKYDNNKFIPIVAGIDRAPIRDRTIVAIRQGRVLKRVVNYNGTDIGEAREIIKDLITRQNVTMVFIDFAYGYDVKDTFKGNDFVYNRIKCVHFGSQLYGNDKSLYTNKRTEIHGKMREWFMQEGGVDIPDSDEIELELAVLPDFNRNVNGQFYMLPKDEIKKQLGGKSPDIPDAIALTFAEDVSSEMQRFVPISKEYDNDIYRTIFPEYFEIEDRDRII